MGVQGESLGKSNNLELLSHANNDKMVRTKLLIYYTFIVRHAKRCNCMSTPMFQISVNSTAEEPSDTLSGIHAYMYSFTVLNHSGKLSVY